MIDLHPLYTILFYPIWYTCWFLCLIGEGGWWRPRLKPAWFLRGDDPDRALLGVIFHDPTAIDKY